jgi:hypothetical protein
VCTNMYMIQKLLSERRQIHFNQSELLLYTQYFKNFDVEPLQFYRLVKLGKWHTAQHGDTLVRRGQVLPEVLMISNGSASVLNHQSNVEYSYVAADLIDNHFSVDENCVIGGIFISLSLFSLSLVLSIFIYPTHKLITQHRYCPCGCFCNLHFLLIVHSLTHSYTHTNHLSYTIGTRKELSKHSNRKR